MEIIIIKREKRQVRGGGGGDISEGVKGGQRINSRNFCRPDLSRFYRARFETVERARQQSRGSLVEPFSLPPRFLVPSPRLLPTFGSRLYSPLFRSSFLPPSSPRHDSVTSPGAKILIKRDTAWRSATRRGGTAREKRLSG